MLIASALSGCSLIGYGIGTLIDHGGAHDSVGIFTDISDYAGEAVQIRYPDSAIRLATFEGYSDEPADTYRTAYDNYSAIHPEIPAIGDSVTTVYYVSDQFVSRHSGSFSGYFPEGILISNEQIPFKKFQEIVLPKRQSKTELKQLFESNLIPIRATLNFRDQNKNFSLTNRDFQNVFVLPHTASARWLGLGIGSAIDVILIVSVVVAGGYHFGPSSYGI